MNLTVTAAAPEPAVAAGNDTARVSLVVCERRLFEAITAPSLALVCRHHDVLARCDHAFDLSLASARAPSSLARSFTVRFSEPQSVVVALFNCDRETVRVAVSAHLSNPAPFLELSTGDAPQLTVHLGSVKEHAA